MANALPTRPIVGVRHAGTREKLMGVNNGSGRDFCDCGYKDTI